MLGKAEIRSRALAFRKALSESDRENKSTQILSTILTFPAYVSSHTIMTYLDFRDEVQTTELAQRILNSEKRLVVPLCNAPETNILPYEISNLTEDITPGFYGIREPNSDRVKLVDPKELDLILVPGVAFDMQGNRIGYGKGYYDRFLRRVKGNIPIIGLAYSCQIFERIVSEMHDITMSHLITENGIVNCKTSNIEVTKS